MTFRRRKWGHEIWINGFHEIEFFHLFPIMHAKTMIFKTISYAWEKTDLVSYNLKMIFKEMRIKEQTCREKIFSAQIIQILSKSFEHTSRNFHKLINYDQYIREVLKKTFMFSEFKKTLKRHIKRNIVSTYSLKLMKTKLNVTSRTSQKYLTLIDWSSEINKSIHLRPMRLSKSTSLDDRFRRANRSSEIYICRFLSS